mmetsp:Transcript_9848/g.29940  ORF Transcript_9848/g.29940 Transcript_9848/m.29940 type:complete len:239 (+) Transcript_9848:443-1159(+)
MDGVAHPKPARGSGRRYGRGGVLCGAPRGRSTGRRAAARVAFSPACCCIGRRETRTADLGGNDDVPDGAVVLGHGAPRGPRVRQALEEVGPPQGNCQSRRLRLRRPLPQAGGHHQGGGQGGSKGRGWHVRLRRRGHRESSRIPAGLLAPPPARHPRPEDDLFRVDDSEHCSHRDRRAQSRRQQVRPHRSGAGAAAANQAALRPDVHGRGDPAARGHLSSSGEGQGERNAQGGGRHELS